MCEFEFHDWKLGEFTENKASHILNLMGEISKVFHWKWIGKNQFSILKNKIWNSGNSVHTTEYLAFVKALLVRLYLNVKVYITKSLSSV